MNERRWGNYSDDGEVGARLATRCVTAIATRQGRPSLTRTLTSRPRSEVGPTGQPARKSVLVGQMAT